MHVEAQMGASKPPLGHSWPPRDMTSTCPTGLGNTFAALEAGYNGQTTNTSPQTSWPASTGTIRPNGGAKKAYTPPQSHHHSLLPLAPSSLFRRAAHK